MEDVLEDPLPRSAQAEFQTTHWSVVLLVGGACESAAQQALEELCRAYWFPLYAYVRRQGQRPEDAQDLTQEFFSRFLERGNFERADPGRGRFRTYLLTCLKRFLNEEWRRANRQKRGGGRFALPATLQDAELRLAVEPSDQLTPDRLYDRRWVEALLERVLVRLRRDYESTGRTTVYAQLQQFLWGPQTEISYVEMGRLLQMNEGAIKVAVHRLRQRYRELLREEVAHTVERPEQVDEELRHMLSVFAD